MYKISNIALTDKNYPPLLKEIPNPPDKLYFAGELPDWQEYTLLTFVGSRKNSSYGKLACEKIIKGLAGYKVVIVSGLAYGIDSIAHKTALQAGLKTIAIPGSGLSEEVIYPRAHLQLAKEIIQSGGALISEFEPNTRASKFSFPQRNRIMAGISHATIIIEATQKSGTLITARLATDFNREVFAIPHDIFRESGKGANLYLSLGANVLTDPKELIEALGIKKQSMQSQLALQTNQLSEKDLSQTLSQAKQDTKQKADKSANRPESQAETATTNQTRQASTPGKPTTADLSSSNSAEAKILQALANQPLSKPNLLRATNLTAPQLSQTLSLLELQGKIKQEGGVWYVV